MITLAQYVNVMGSGPPYNELERCNCANEGEQGHRYCGWCSAHNKPRAMCGCQAKWKETIIKSTLHDFQGVRRTK